MRKCRTMNHLEKGYYRQLQNFIFWRWSSQGSIHQSWLVLESSDDRAVREKIEIQVLHLAGTTKISK